MNRRAPLNATGLLLLALLAAPLPATAGSKSPPPPTPPPTRTGPATTQAPPQQPKLSAEDRKVIEMMELLNNMPMLQDMDLLTPKEEKR